ncbi:hypothetical protein [Kurthia gibsonii]|uniref:hypothetical protein n=1 Tax=Kurthia gibsonii TaxID=33946 RepID=UPI002DBD5819|nr:hypothetical protein [Kurthia gibsonii]MEB7771339.1 hypothetical protein [Kurthia gibsonii]
MNVKSVIRTIGISIFVAGATMSLTQMKQEADGKTTPAKDEVVVKKSDIKQYQQQITKLQEENAVLAKKKDTTPSKAKKEVKTYTLDVRSGMGTSEVSEALEKAGMIKSASDFESYIINEGKASSIQLGKNKLNSEMSQKEILTAITTPK